MCVPRPAVFVPRRPPAWAIRPKGPDKPVSPADGEGEILGAVCPLRLLLPPWPT